MNERCPLPAGGTSVDVMYLAAAGERPTHRARAPFGGKRGEIGVVVEQQPSTAVQPAEHGIELCWLERPEVGAGRSNGVEDVERSRTERHLIERELRELRAAGLGGEVHLLGQLAHAGDQRGQHADQLDCFGDLECEGLLGHQVAAVVEPHIQRRATE